MDNTFNLLKAWIEFKGYEIESLPIYLQSNDDESHREWCGTEFKFKKKPKQSKPRTVEYSEEFEQAWKIYPKKSGNKKAAAYEQWNARLSNCDRSPLEIRISMLEGTKRYAAYHKALNTPEQYIHQGSTFYGRERLYLDEWTVPKEVTKLKLPFNDDELAGFAYKHGLSEPPRGMGFREYRSLLTNEINTRGL